ncbi:MAG TPA: NADH-quinone oxidoreductase subunit C [Candidatus Kryptonia bacterium]
MKEKIEAKLREAFGDAIVNVEESRGQVVVEIRRERIVEVCKFLKEDAQLSFDLLSDICGADMLDFEDDSSRKAYLAIEHAHRPASVPVAERFLVVYQLTSIANKTRLRLKAKVDGENPICPSVTPVFPAANWYEREAFDMFGISFDGHPDMRRMYMPEEYEYNPLRKDFPLMGIPGSIPLPRK